MASPRYPIMVTERSLPMIMKREVHMSNKMNSGPQVDRLQIAEPIDTPNYSMAATGPGHHPILVRCGKSVYLSRDLARMG